MSSRGRASGRAILGSRQPSGTAHAGTNEPRAPWGTRGLKSAGAEEAWFYFLNWAASVDSSIARVDEEPPVMTLETSSK